MSTPLRIYVGMQEEQLLTYLVLAYSIRKHARIPVEVVPLHEAIAANGIVIPESAHKSNAQHTPFSLQRFAIPQLEKFQGTSVYLDSDMLVFRDIGDLLNSADPAAEASAAAEPPDSGRKSQISVMVLNCARLDWDVRRIAHDLDAGVYTYRQLYSDLPIVKKLGRSIPHTWNDLERHTPGATALTHFTDMETQPWLTVSSKLGKLWCENLLEAIRAGAIPAAIIAEHAARGWVRPSLVHQVEHGIADPAQLPPAVTARDGRAFTPPHRLGIIARGWARDFASRATDYGSETPRSSALVMRSVQAFAYRIYKRVRAKSLNARL